NAVLRIGDPRTSLLSRGVRGLPAASTLVPARLGIDGALSMRHLCLWTCLLPTSLLPLSCSLPAPARVHSRCTAGSSPAISASRLVVVKRGSGFCRYRFRAAPSTCRARATLTEPRYLLMQIAGCVAFARASMHSERVLYGVPWPPSDVTR